jgi:cell growth-regulating nucleolar protein
MVYFQCELCIETLKKKQVERHHFSCRGAKMYSCLTCHNLFDLESIKPHTSCVTEEEKYQKGDMNYGKDKNFKINNNNHKVNPNVKPEEFQWKGFRKTGKEVLSNFEFKKIEIGKLNEFLMKIYARANDVDFEDVDVKVFKNMMMDKYEDSNKFVIDLSKNTIRYKF